MYIECLTSFYSLFLFNRHKVTKLYWQQTCDAHHALHFCGSCSHFWSFLLFFWWACVLSGFPLIISVLEVISPPLGLLCTWPLVMVSVFLLHMDNFVLFFSLSQNLQKNVHILFSQGPWCCCCAVNKVFTIVISYCVHVCFYPPTKSKLSPKSKWGEVLKKVLKKVRSCRKTKTTRKGFNFCKLFCPKSSYQTNNLLLNVAKYSTMDNYICNFFSRIFMWGPFLELWLEPLQQLFNLGLLFFSIVLYGW